ncbi:hypothetical protein P5673_022470 [Acropora cervicornis]|uniref:Uncharacterized protein n=1 Tax=Acropora cervicornis TaxID=6130 RepID=A0AAD9UZL2_ACRCE|nr:hypothetical protein P5673_022470 [Acropora cervicornis]
MVQSYFEREDTNLEVSVTQLFEQMENHESELSCPPSEGLDTMSLLRNLKVNTPSSDFSRMVNENVEMLLEERFMNNVKAFVDIMWFHSFLALESHIVENPDNLDIKVTRGDFTTATGKLNQLFASPEFYRYILCLFNAPACSTAQRSIAVELGTAVYFKFLEHLLSISRKEYRQEVVSFNVDDMSAAGRAKVRHVGGWAIRKVLEKSRRYVRANIWTENPVTMSTVQQHHSICELIEESLIGSVAVLEQESQHKDTLEVTEAHQYRETGLVHIEDAVYRFFMFLEKQRVHLLNDGMLRIEGANMVEEAYRKLKENNELKLKWQECFNSKDCEERKEILKDRSPGKVSSHERLLHFLEKHSDASVFVRVYTKAQLISLCMAYEVRFKQRDTKKVLATTLVETLKQATCRSIPFTALVDDRQFEVVRTINDEADATIDRNPKHIDCRSNQSLDDTNWLLLSKDSFLQSLINL